MAGATRMDSLELCARFSLPPNTKGYCGRGSLLPAFRKHLEQGSARSRARLRAELCKLPLMRSYLETIALANGIDDEFSYEAVEAFWIGNKLLERVGRDDLVELFGKKWVKRGISTKAHADAIVARLPARCAPPHHSFHPYVAQFVSPKAKKTAGNKDKCRPSWGKVGFAGEKAITVSMPHVGLENGKFVLQKPLPTKLSREIGGIRLVEDCAKLVAGHWGCAVLEINANQARAMEKYTKLSLATANAPPRGINQD